MIFNGRARIFGDDLDTDVIISGKYLRGKNPKVWAEHIFEVLENNYSSTIESGDIIIAGKNFACGSSREQAAIAIKEAGFSAVVAKSVGRIFFRNAINIGLPVLVCKDLIIPEEGDKVLVDFLKGTLEINSQIFQGEVLPAFMLNILKSGGLINYFNKESNETL